MKEYKWMSLNDVLRSIPAMDKQNVSEVARGKKMSKQTKEGWVQAFIATNGSPKKMGERLTGRSDWETWKDRRQQFLARHLKQIKTSGEKIWKDGEPSRRHLALVAWGYTPTPKKFKEWLKTQPSLQSEAWRKGVKMPKRKNSSISSLQELQDAFYKEPTPEFWDRLKTLLFSENKENVIMGFSLLERLEEPIYYVALATLLQPNGTTLIFDIPTDTQDVVLAELLRNSEKLHPILQTSIIKIGLKSNDNPDIQSQAFNLLRKIAQTPQDVYDVLDFVPQNLNVWIQIFNPNVSFQIAQLLDSLGDNTIINNTTKLDLRHNQLTELPQSIGNLTNLTELDLRYNQLTSIPTSIGNLTNLTILDLEGNQLTVLPESIGNLTNLKELNLQGNKLTEIPNTIGNLTNLTELGLWNNQLTTLPESFGNLTNLTKLKLYNNQLTTLPESFGNLANLTQLILTSNQLTSYPESMLNLKNLEYISLEDEAPSVLRNFLIYTLGLKERQRFGRFEYYDAQAYFKNPKSKRTRKNSSISSLQELQDAFYNKPTPEFWSRLKTLLFSENKQNVLMGFHLIENLKEPIYYVALATLLQPNGTTLIFDIPTDTQDVVLAELLRNSEKLHPILQTSIIKIGLKSNDNPDIQSQAFNLLRKIAQTPHDVYDVLGNDWWDADLNDLLRKFNPNASLQIAQLLSDLGDNTIINNTTQLNLRGNQLTTLPSSIGNLTNLKLLRLNNNQLTTLPESIGNLTNLTELDLYGNQLTTLPESFENLTNLTYLDLGGNQLTSLPESIGNLTYLTLSRNQLTSLPEFFGNFTNLTYLDLRYNLLTSLPSSIGNLTNLTYLDLRYNQLTTLPESIGNLTNLTELDLRHNQLTKIPKSLNYIPHLYIDNNVVLKNNPKSKRTRKNSSISTLKQLQDAFYNKPTPEFWSRLKTLLLSEDKENVIMGFSLLENLKEPIYYVALATLLQPNGNALISDIPTDTQDVVLAELLRNSEKLHPILQKSIIKIGLFNDNPDIQSQAITLLESIAKDQWDVYEALGDVRPTVWEHYQHYHDTTRLSIIKLLSTFGDNVVVDETTRVNLRGWIENEFPHSLTLLKNLTYLDLRYNQLTSLPESIGNLTNLITLDVSHNQLTKIPQSIGNLTNLTFLDLGYNQLTTLPESIGNLTNLTSLTLSRNQLTSLPEFFGNFTNLTYLDLSDNQLTSLPESIGNLTNLTILDLRSNQLTEIPEFIGNLTNLTELALKGNLLTEIPQSLKNIRYLSYDDNVRLKNNPKSKRTKRTRKNSSISSLKQLQDAFYKKPTPQYWDRLKTLLFSENKQNVLMGFHLIENLKEPIYYVALATLLQPNGTTLIFDIPTDTQDVVLAELLRNSNKLHPILQTSIIKIGLSNDNPNIQSQALNLVRKIAQTPQDVYDVLGFVPQNLDELIKKFNLNVSLQIVELLSSLGDNTIINNTTQLIDSGKYVSFKLTEIPESIGNLTNLTYLDLQSNELTELPQSIENLTNLTKLGLSYNKLTEIPQSIGNLTNLTKLGLSYNQLTTLPESIGNLTNLTFLSLYNNQLTTLPESVGNLTNIIKLVLESNQLTELPESIGNLTHLTALELSSNLLTTLPKSIVNLTNLTSLYLRDNQLTELPESIGNLTNLEYMVLDFKPSPTINNILENMGLTTEGRTSKVFRYEKYKNNPKSNTTYDLITDSKGRKIPKRYVSGYKGKDKSKRVNEIEKRRDEYDKAKDKYGAEKNFPKKVLQKLYRPFRTDKGVKTTPSKYTKIAKDRGIVGNLNEKAKTASKYYGGKISKALLKKVYNKGMGAWSSGGHRVGATSHAWAMARVNSFLVGGKTYWTADNYLAQQLPAKVRKAIEKKPAWKPSYRKNPLPLIKLHSELIPIEDMNSKRWFKSNHTDFYYHLDRNIFPTEIGDVVMDTIDPCLISLVAFLIQRGVLTGSSCQGHDEDNLIDQRFSNHMHDIQQVRTKGLVVTDLETEDQYLWHDPQYTSPYANVEDMTSYISSTEVTGSLTVYLCQEDFKVFHQLSPMIDSLGFDMIVPDNYQTEEVIEMTITTSAQSEQEICDKWNALENLLKQYIS